MSKCLQPLFKRTAIFFFCDPEASYRSMGTNTLSSTSVNSWKTRELQLQDPNAMFTRETQTPKGEGIEVTQRSQQQLVKIPLPPALTLSHHTFCLGLYTKESQPFNRTLKWLHWGDLSFGFLSLLKKKSMFIRQTVTTEMKPV